MQEQKKYKSKDRDLFKYNYKKNQMLKFNTHLMKSKYNYNTSCKNRDLMNFLESNNKINNSNLNISNRANRTDRTNLIKKYINGNRYNTMLNDNKISILEKEIKDIKH